MTLRGRDAKAAGVRERGADTEESAPPRRRTMEAKAGVANIDIEVDFLDGSRTTYTCRWWERAPLDDDVLVLGNEDGSETHIPLRNLRSWRPLCHETG